MAEHTKGARASTKDKHTNRQTTPVKNKKYAAGKMDKVKVQPTSPAAKKPAKKSGGGIWPFN